jgi:hypothetical protein
MLDQRARRRRSFGPAVALTLRCRNDTWKQPHDGGCARRPAPPRRRNTAAGPLPYPEFRRRRRESKRWPTNRAAALRLGTELGDLAVRLLPHSPQGPSPPPNAASSPASSASPAAHGRKSDTPGLRVVLHPSDAPQHVPTLFVWTRPTAPGPGTTVAGPPGTRDGSYPCGFTPTSQSLLIGSVRVWASLRSHGALPCPNSVQRDKSVSRRWE